MSVPVTRTPIPPDDSGPDRSPTVVWLLYWCCLFVSVSLAFGFAVAVGAAGGDQSRSGGALRFVVRLLTLSFPFLWLVAGSPPGYPALHYYRSRLSPLADAERSTRPSAGRTGFELLSVTVIAASMLAANLFAESHGLVSDPKPVFTLAALGLLLGAISWFGLWIMR